MLQKIRTNNFKLIAPKPIIKLGYASKNNNREGAKKIFKKIL